jgi:hypothetical protein
MADSGSAIPGGGATLVLATFGPLPSTGRFGSAMKWPSSSRTLSAQRKSVGIDVQMLVDERK